MAAFQWKLLRWRRYGPGAALRGTSNSKLRRILDQNQTSGSVEIAIGDSVFSLKGISRKSTPGRRGPAAILGIDQTGSKAKFQGQTFEIARHCARKRIGASTDSGVGTPDVGRLPRDGQCPDEPPDAEIPPEPCELPTGPTAGMPVAGPVLAVPASPRRMSGCSDVGGITDGLGSMKPMPPVGPPCEPSANPHFFGDMPKKRPHTPWEQRGYADRDAWSVSINILLAMDRGRSKRALHGPDTEFCGEETCYFGRTAFRLRGGKRSR